ncbi:MAG: coiled-coil domain-containing protein [Mycoplasmatales bacterium]
MPKDLLKIHKLNFMKYKRSQNCKTIKKDRPCIIIQVSAEGMYYGTTAYIAIPLSSNYHKNLENYQVKISTNQISYALIYNFMLVTAEELKIWYDKEGKTLSIKPEELKKIIDVKIYFNIIGGNMSLEHYQRKPYILELMERIEKSNEELKADNQELKADNKQIKADNRDYNRELNIKIEKISQINEELRKSNKKLKKDNQKLKQKIQELNKNSLK